MPQPPIINDDEGGQSDEPPSSSSRPHPPSSLWRQGRRIAEPQETPEPTSREDRQRLQLQPIQPRSPSDQPPFQAYRQPQRTPSGGPYPISPLRQVWTEDDLDPGHRVRPLLQYQQTRQPISPASTIPEERNPAHPIHPLLQYQRPGQPLSPASTIPEEYQLRVYDDPSAIPLHVRRNTRIHPAPHPPERPVRTVPSIRSPRDSRDAPTRSGSSSGTSTPPSAVLLPGYQRSRPSRVRPRGSTTVVTPTLPTMVTSPRSQSGDTLSSTTTGSPSIGPSRVPNFDRIAPGRRRATMSSVRGYPRTRGSRERSIEARDRGQPARPSTSTGIPSSTQLPSIFQTTRQADSGGSTLRANFDPSWSFDLQILQMPTGGRALIRERYRRTSPILSPPLILRLIARDRHGVTIDPQNPELIRRLTEMALHAGLTDETGRQDRSKVFITGSDDWRPPSQTPTKALLGLTLVSPRSYWINGEYMHLLTFPDLTVRPAGVHALRLRLVGRIQVPFGGVMVPIAPGGLMREVITPTFDVRRDWQEEPGESSLSAQLRVQGERYLKKPGRRGLQQGQGSSSNPNPPPMQARDDEDEEGEPELSDGAADSTSEDSDEDGQEFQED